IQDVQADEARWVDADRQPPRQPDFPFPQHGVPSYPTPDLTGAEEILGALHGAQKIHDGPRCAGVTISASIADVIKTETKITSALASAPRSHPRLYPRRRGWPGGGRRPTTRSRSMDRSGPA